MSMSLRDWLRDSQGTSLLTNGDSARAGSKSFRSTCTQRAELTAERLPVLLRGARLAFYLVRNVEATMALKFDLIEFRERRARERRDRACAVIAPVRRQKTGRDFGAVDDRAHKQDPNP